MRISLSRWKPGHLLAAWSVYWLGLAAATLTPIALAIHRATQSGAARGAVAAGKATVSASLGSAGIGVTVTRLGETLLSRSVELPALFLWIAGPPLALWGFWLWTRSRAMARGELAGAGATRGALEEGAGGYDGERGREHARTNKSG